MNRYLSRLARGVTPYVPGEQPGNSPFIKLNTNENPYPPSPRVLKVIKEAAGENLRLYPDPEGVRLRQMVADYYGLDSEMVFVGNGSDELLAFSFQAFFDPGKEILFPAITYSFYPVYCSLYRIDYQTVSLEEDLSLPPEAFLQKNHGIIFPNPNAPTGRYLEQSALEEIISHNQESVVIIDEAYIDFGGRTAVNLTMKYPNLLVIQTLSKSRSLAGLRVGFAIGQEGLIEGLNRIKNSTNSYTLDRLALAGAAAAFEDEEYFLMTRKKIITTREQTSRRLEKLGFRVVPSRANFVFITHPDFRADYLLAALRDNGILVRHFNQQYINNYLRVSIGSDREMEQLLTCLRVIIEGGKKENAT